MKNLVLDNCDYECEWPDGDVRMVRVHKIEDGKAWVLWNEPHEPIEGELGCAVGLTDIVPIEWIIKRLKP